jgi:hypothetical protein
MKAFLTIDEPTTQIVRASLERIYNLTYIKTVNELVPRIKYLFNFEDSPSILVMHCGGNSIGQVPLLDLRNQIGSSLWEIQPLLLSTRQVWSQILPRSSWRYSSNNMALHFAAWFCIQLVGAYVKYP